MTKLGFVRHGVTDWNKERRAQGSSDVALNEEGLLQAETLADRLGTEDWDVIYSSDLARAKQTAETIGSKLKDVSVYFDPRLREVGGGLIEGTTEKERIAKWGDNWRELDLERESNDSILARGRSIMDEILKKQNGKNILIVSHGSFIKHLLKELLPDEDVEESLGNCSLTTLQNNKDTWKLELHNCTRHFSEHSLH
ncbi:histidine phosphatase family protein [Virgibacillus dakarensis]|uniref:Phosphoglycerate mutase n=1 Tax=Lentibacillus populi TaxID=1827502 RepID=A0A9W5TVP3_9BACI|nr:MULTISPECIES: histidine phosphatase family protein [Bacillaceae]MBT2214348.1 phosphoglycerate mutase family protein [Virgibacillus dakarensis]MTW85025.1 histidine phosphatase family protein [Virgibacillus dakarensis]GGB34159.1 phosphoglycerate mutase [Lentibacillus populi]